MVKNEKDDTDLRAAVGPDVYARIVAARQGDIKNGPVASYWEGEIYVERWADGHEYGWRDGRKVFRRSVKPDESPSALKKLIGLNLIGDEDPADYVRRTRIEDVGGITPEQHRAEVEVALRYGVAAGALEMLGSMIGKQAKEVDAIWAAYIADKPHLRGEDHADK